MGRAGPPAGALPTRTGSALGACGVRGLVDRPGELQLPFTGGAHERLSTGRPSTRLTSAASTHPRWLPISVFQVRYTPVAASAEDDSVVAGAADETPPHSQVLAAFDVGRDAGHGSASRSARPSRLRTVQTTSDGPGASKI